MKSLLCDAGSELRLLIEEGEKKRRANITNGMEKRKKQEEKIYQVSMINHCK